MTPAVPQSVGSVAAAATSSHPGVTAGLARFISASAGTRLPPPVQHATCRAFANWLGCALGAAGDASLAPVLRVALELGGSEQASIVGRRERTDAVNCALVNGYAANALDFTTCTWTL